MKKILIALGVSLLALFYGVAIESAVACGLWAWFLADFFFRSRKELAFTQFLFVLYGLNFLWGPVLSYSGENIGSYRMKVSESEYFAMAIPAMLMLYLGVHTFRTKIFRPEFHLLQVESFLNEKIFKSWVIIGLILSLIRSSLPAELAFFVYLLSGLRFIGVYGLLIINRKKYVWYLVVVFAQLLAESLVGGMFHDFMMWSIFTVILWLYIAKPRLGIQLMVAAAGIAFYFLLQVSKGDYRQSVSSGEAGFESFIRVLENNLASEDLISEQNVNSSVSRVNQAWIFASTVENMNRQQDFQGGALVALYLEAALLPRFVAPDKLKAGDKEIFNKYSGHQILEDTSMGLGIFADGYIAYGYWGVLIFAYLFGLIFCLIFKVVERWTRISPFFVFFIFPILNYAVRPDCETQTLLGHLVKGYIVFGILMVFYKGYFNKQIIVLSKAKSA